MTTLAKHFKPFYIINFIKRTASSWACPLHSIVLFLHFLLRLDRCYNLVEVFNLDGQRFLSDRAINRLRGAATGLGAH